MGPDTPERGDKEWLCPVCNKYFDDTDPGLLWGKCPECGSSCTFLGGVEKFHLAEALLLETSKEYSLPIVDIEGMKPMARARAFLSRDECLKLTAVPIRHFGSVLVVASAVPDLLSKWIADTGFEKAKSVKVRMVLARVGDIIELVMRTFG